MKNKKAKFIVLPIIIIAALAVAGALFYALMNSRTFMFFNSIITHGPEDEKAVYLTFDDGPTARTPEILKLLDELDVKATFFLIGRNMEEHPEYVQNILEKGHCIGNHTYAHARMVFLPLDRIRDEVEKTNAAIRKAGYEGEIFFRMPYCKKLFLLPWYLSQTGQRTVTWTIEPESDREAKKTAEAMAGFTAKQLKNGSIILLHPMGDGTGKTLDAIRLIVEDAREKGYIFKTVSEMEIGPENQNE